MANAEAVKVTIKDNKLTRPTFSVCVIGHVDAGKSSLTGQLLYKCNAIDTRKLEKLKAEANQNNMGTFFLAYATDTNPDEKKRGITIVSNTKQFSLSSGQLVTIVDAPGHRDFINNMITGAAQCNYAILVVSAVPTEFRAGIHPTGQTLEHMLLVTALGVKKIICVVNKIDGVAKDKREASYTEIKDEITRAFKKFGGKEANMSFVPISGFAGINIDKVDSEETPWYKGTCLLDTMDEWPLIEHDLTIPMRMSVTGMCKVSGAGQVITGKVHSGIIKVGDAVESKPTEFKTTVKSIEKFHKNEPEAYPDDNIGITLKGKSDDKANNKKGDLIGAADTGLTSVKRFTGMFVMTGVLKNDLQKGFKPVISTHTCRVAAVLADIKSIKEKKTNKEVISIRQTIKTGDRVMAEFQPEKSISMESDKKYGLLTRFVIRNSNTTIGIGQCKEFCNDKFVKDLGAKIKNDAKGSVKKTKKK